nr:ABC transporter ATP-binding protein [Alkalibacter mobilis]
MQVGYGNKVVIDNVNIQGLKGQLICLLGPNGAGKSTILRTLTGLLKPVNGTVYIGNDNINTIKKNDLAKKMAVVLTEQLSLNMMTVFEVASMGRYPYTNFRGKLTDHDVHIIDNALASVHASHLRNRYFFNLSDGEKQKIMIARALVQAPELLVLDEPTSHLDVKHKVEVINILRNLCLEKGITVILSLHDIDIAIKGCQQILLLQNEKIVAQGTPEEIIKCGTIQDLYEIKGANYSELLGSIEFNNSTCAPEVFIFAGNGSGVGICRAVARAGYGIYCGILHKNDVDFHIGQALGCHIIAEESFENISEQKYNLALEKIKEVPFLIDTGFHVGSMNQLNIKLLEEAAKINKTIFSLSPYSDFQKRYGSFSNKIVPFKNIEAVIQKMTEMRNDA